MATATAMAMATATAMGTKVDRKLFFVFVFNEVF
jgi:hypothetical protein